MGDSVRSLAEVEVDNVIKAKSQLYLLKPNLFKQANKQAKKQCWAAGGVSCSSNSAHRPVPFPSLYMVC